jgi:ubiquitin-protein ligase
MAMQTLRRVNTEIQDVNNDFHSLRTVLRPSDDKSLWNFVMFPNDGAMSHLPLIGELIIQPTYPNEPPVLHLFTQTNRWNVDVYRASMNDPTHSTMCFDILRSGAEGGTWDRSYTISCLFASLMQAIVTPDVEQVYGGELHEFVSMEKLDGIKQAANTTYWKHRAKFPTLPQIPTIPATVVKAERLSFTHTRAYDPSPKLYFNGTDTFVSRPFYLQQKGGNAWSALLDLRNLHPGVVFSVILSNQPGTDNTGRYPETILLRNGVTGTAAKKISDRPLKWFYHGKPLNEGNLLLSITVTQDQFTMSYKSAGTDSYLVHGDTPISKLGRAQIGNVENIPFYLTLFLKLKSGKRGFIDVLDQRGVGHIHEGTIAPPAPPAPRSSSAPKSHGPAPEFIKLTLTGEQTRSLSHILDLYDVGREFKIKRSELEVGHQTLLHSADMTTQQYADVVNDIYRPMQGEGMVVSVEAIVADDKCVAFLTSNPLCSNGAPLPFYPRTRLMHITMRLRDEMVKPVYANTVAQRILGAIGTGESLQEGDRHIPLPQAIKLWCPLQFHFHR